MSKTPRVLIVGAGLYGSVCAYELKKKGMNVTVIDKREHIGGNCYTDNVEGIHVHKYGPHIFHTNDEKIWNWISKFTEFEDFKFSPVAKYKGGTYSLPFNMWTFNQIYGDISPDKLAESLAKYKEMYPKPKNLEEKAISLVGNEVYKTLIEGYTTKQWGQSPKHLPSSIITRLPVRFTYDANYFNDKYQGIPKNGYTQIFNRMLDKIDVQLGVEFDVHSFPKKDWDYIIYTGPIDAFFDFQFGRLDYRSLRWEQEIHTSSNYQGTSVVNYTSMDIPYTRIIEHKHFNQESQSKSFTVVSKEYPQKYDGMNEPFYPINNGKNLELLKKYKREADKLQNYHFGGRLAEYRYYDMHQVIGSALSKIPGIIRRIRSLE
jgi:UDP-galactopyranose mutase